MTVPDWDLKQKGQALRLANDLILLRKD
jgi:hypothetical protein